jgi:hypothetical protein
MRELENAQPRGWVYLKDDEPLVPRPLGNICNTLYGTGNLVSASV